MYVFKMITACDGRFKIKFLKMLQGVYIYIIYYGDKIT